MQQLRQHTFGCGHCALCVAAKSVFALFAGFLTLALTFASTLILSSVLFTSTAFAQVNAENSGSAASAQTVATTQNASNKTAGQSDSAATANAGNTSEKANAALATNYAARFRASPSAFGTTRRTLSDRGCAASCCAPQIASEAQIDHLYRTAANTGGGTDRQPHPK